MERAHQVENGPGDDSAGGLAPVAVIFLAGLVGGALANLLIPAPVWPSFWIRLAGLAPLAVGIVLFTWSRAAFRRHRTPLMPWSPSSALVSDGPYSYSRNPIYLAFGFMYLGAALILNSAYVLVMLVVVLVLFDRAQIPREEGYLQAKFGEEFSRYKARVRRWI
jgi:protein-S-isoprenylcysteine O-methyltransferase Ste14